MAAIPPPVRYFVGLDLGQSNDFSALVACEADRINWRDPPAVRPDLRVRYVRRWPLGTPYTQVVGDADALMRRDPLRGHILAVDATGVGRAVVDVFREQNRREPAYTLAPVLITGGQDAAYNEAKDISCVPKKDLVGVLQVLLQRRRLKVAAGMPLTPMLVRELENFRLKTSETGKDAYEAWKSGDHDDLVLALGMAAWVAEQVVEAGPPAGWERVAGHVR